jgi:hypothetical protein
MFFEEFISLLLETVKQIIHEYDKDAEFKVEVTGFCGFQSAVAVVMKSCV